MPPIIAVGASQGGVNAVRGLTSGLPADFPAAILIVVHIGRGPSTLPSILNRAGRLRASHARDGDRIEPGHILVAPPNRHLLLADGKVELSHGPRENWARPAIDPLFRSAAEAYGQGVIGVVLSGGLNDGTVGLYEIKRRGGIAVVQDPSDAEAPSMPRSALDNVAVDYCVPLTEIPGLLSSLAGDLKKRPRSHTESGVHVMEHAGRKLQHPVAQTCPDCGGAMREERLGTLTQFRCHIGHVMTAETLAAVQVEILERDVSAVLRTLNERAELCLALARAYGKKGDAETRNLWTNAAEEAKNREDAIRAMARAEWIRPESAEPAAG
ncbi:MAG TPA: chemotaxis protein CheB [Rhizomicrobium sp.]|jgi:two-component system chemotaxis response regulator CheB|nr:chemotaxis protein CheB [Rhizomicrobium sp.]